LAETPAIPVIGQALSKQYALPYGLWGLLYDDWAPSYEKDGLPSSSWGLISAGPITAASASIFQRSPRPLTPNIPPFVRQIGHGLNAVIAFRDPMLGVVYDNYMKVRQLRTPLEEWIDAKTNEVMNGKIKNPEGTFVYYWTKNGKEGEDFRRKDIVFECFHNIAAIRGNAIYDMMVNRRTGLVQKDHGKRSRQA
jgi:hypothetical protein